MPADAATPESIAADEALLVVCATALTDIKALETQMWKLWRDELRMMLPEMSMSEDEEIDLEGPCIYSAILEPTLIPHPAYRHTPPRPHRNPLIRPATLQPSHSHSLQTRLRRAPTYALHPLPIPRDVSE